MPDVCATGIVVRVQNPVIKWESPQGRILEVSTSI